VACPSQTYVGLQRDGISWAKLSGRFSGPVGSYFEPDSLADLVNVVQRASAQGHMLHVVGSGWAFENIAWSPDWMVSLTRLNRRLTNVTGHALNPQWLASQAAASDRLFHIEAGATIADLNDALAAAGLAMPTLGGSVGQAVAGALSTSTHGGDPTQSPLADVVMAMHLVTAAGRELWIERASEPINRRCRPSPGAVVPRLGDRTERRPVQCAASFGFGRFGIILLVRAARSPGIPSGRMDDRGPANRHDRCASGRHRRGHNSWRRCSQCCQHHPAALGSLDLAKPSRPRGRARHEQPGALFGSKRRWATSDNTDLNVTESENALCQIGAAGVLAAGLIVLGAFVAAPF